MSPFKKMALAVLEAHGDSCEFCPLHRAERESECDALDCAPGNYICRCDACDVARKELS